MIWYDNDMIWYDIYGTYVYIYYNICAYIHIIFIQCIQFKQLNMALPIFHHGVNTPDSNEMAGLVSVLSWYPKVGRGGWLISMGTSQNGWMMRILGDLHVRKAPYIRIYSWLTTDYSHYDYDVSIWIIGLPSNQRFLGIPRGTTSHCSQNG